MTGILDPQPELGDRQELLRYLLEAEGIAISGEATVSRRRTSGPAPLSYAQERLWFLAQLVPNEPFYNVCTAHRLYGELDVDALRRALEELVRRHSVLRSAFRVQDGVPVQIEHGELPALAMEDAVSEEELQRIATREWREPLDLAAGRVVRFRLVRREANHHVLLVALHHIVFDAASSEIFLRDLGAIYGAFRRGEPSPLRPLDLQYADFAAWQRQRLQDVSLRGLRSYWMRQLDRLPEALEMPTDRVRPPVQSFKGSTVRRELPRHLTEGVRQLGEDEGATLFMTTLAVFEILLHRYSGSDDVVIGTPIANRMQSELEEVIGFFTNSLVLRTDLSGNPTFRDLLDRVREVCLDAYSHQEMPFEKLVAELNPERQLSRNPLFQHVFMLHHEGDQPSLPGLRVASQAVGSESAKFDLSFSIAERGDQLVSIVQYNTDLYDASSMERMLRHYETLLEAVIDDPEAHIDTLPMLPFEEAAQVEEWGHGAAPMNVELTLDAFDEQVRARPEALAVSDGAMSMTYAQLDERASAIAGNLIEWGVREDDIVAVVMPRSAESIAALLGIWKAGAAYLPIDPEYPQERIDFMLEDSGTKVVLTPENVNVGRASARLGGLKPALRSLAYVIYTSGSTGKPKGVLVDHAALANLVAWHRRAFAITPDDRATRLAGFSFDASVWETWPYLAAGASVHMAPEEVPASPEKLVQWLADERITITFLPTPLAMAALPDLEQRDDLALRAILTGGDRLTRRPGRDCRFTLFNQYGPTENAVVTTWCAVDRDSGSAPPIGRPIDGVDVAIVDRNGQLSPIGIPGELLIAGAGLARGYHMRPELTDEKFIERQGRRWYRSGDLVRWNEGQIEFLGRRDDQVKIRGYRIETGEVEAALARLDGVREAAVIARHGRAGARLVAYVVASRPAEELCERLGRVLPHFMVPSAFVMLDALPVTPSGKVDRHALPDPVTHGEERRVPPRDAVEEAVASIWCDVLHLDDVSVHEDFFAAGGHSLLAARLIVRVRETLGVDLPLQVIFTAPTIAGIAAECVRVRMGGLKPALHAIVRREERTAPLSYAQERLWFLEQLVPGGALYNITRIYRLRGAVDVVTVQQALDTIVERHAILRTAFVTTPSGPMQFAHDPMPAPFRIVDDADFIRVADEERRQSFDLTRAPLLRAVFVRIAPDDQVLVVTVHHIVFDGWSADVLERELVAAYRGELLPELPVQYGDFAAAQREGLTGDALASLTAYWRERLAGAPPLELPTDRVRPAVQTYRGANEVMPLPSGTAAALAELGHSEGATPFMTLLAAFNVLLARYSGQTDISVGTPVANRNAAEVEGLIGFFVNTLVLRTDLSGDPTFRELLARVRQVCLGAWEHQDMPFEKLVEELNPQREMSRNPLFQTMLLFRTAGRGAMPFGDATLTVENGSGDTSKFDLTMAVVARGAELTCAAQYNTDLYEPATVRRLLGHFGTLLAAAAKNPDARISSLPLLEPAEHEQLVAWNATSVDYGAGLLVHELIERQARATPEATALVFRGESMTYAELDRRATALAYELRRRGVRPNALVGLCVERSFEMVLAIVATLKAGGAYVPIDPDYPFERLRYMLDEAQPAVVLAQEKFLPRLPQCNALGIESAIESALHAESADAVPAARPHDDDLAYVIYTSGSTGRPKGAMNTHGAIRNRLLWFQHSYHAIGHGDVVMQKTPYGFDISVWELLWPLITGARLVIAEPGGHQDVLYLIDLIRRERVTIAHFVPSMLQIFLDEKEAKTCTSLRHVICSGEALPLELAKRFAAALPAELHNLYGPTEAAVEVTYWPCSMESGAASVPIGFPIANVQIHILDKRLQPVPAGVPGELFIGGVAVARGYLARPDLTAEKFIADPFSERPGARMYRSGDLARWRADGSIEYLGRIDHQVKIRGFRIELGEIESVLATVPAVRDVVVVAHAGADGDKRLVAYAAPRDGEQLDAATLRNACRESLPEYMVPAVFVLLPALPLNANGKVDRKALPAPEVQSVRAAYVPLQSETERLVASVWQNVLGVTTVGVEDNFFDLGGHSLLMVRVRMQLREALDRDVSMIDLFRHTTVGALARHLGEVDSTQQRLQNVRERAHKQKLAMHRRKPLQRNGETS